VTVRRLVALSLALSMVNLNSLRADNACADHGEYSQLTSPTHHGATHTTGSDVHTAAATQTEACDTPTLPACCQMLASCSTVLGVHNGAQIDQRGPIHRGILAAVEAAPASRVASPDPPPPRP
jgi:hypothetical protein